MARRKKQVDVHFRWMVVKRKLRNIIPSVSTAVRVSTIDVSTRYLGDHPKTPVIFAYSPRGRAHKGELRPSRDRRKAKKLTKKFLAPIPGFIDTRAGTRAGRKRVYDNMLRGMYTDEMLAETAELKRSLARPKMRPNER